MKLSIIIICWNDLKTIRGCLDSIYENTHNTTFEIIVSDNGSTDRSVEFIRKHYPQVRVIENGTNLRFAKANNVGIRVSHGEYVLILNPDTIIHEATLDKLVTFADEHPEAGAFGCKVLNPDGSYQESARPFPTLRGEWVAALYLRPLAHLSDWFISDTYTGWKGDTERTVDWISGCSLFARREVVGAHNRIRRSVLLLLRGRRLVPSDLASWIPNSFYAQYVHHSFRRTVDQTLPNCIPTR